MSGPKDKSTPKVKHILKELSQFINNLNQFLIIIDKTPDKIPEQYEEYKQYEDPNKAIEHINYLLSEARRVAIDIDKQRKVLDKQTSLGKRITDLKLGDKFEKIKQKLTSTQNLTPKNKTIYLSLRSSFSGTIAKSTSSSIESTHEKPESYAKLPDDEGNSSLGDDSKPSSTPSSPRGTSPRKK